MASLNRVQLIGHLGRDPEIRRTQDGRPIANLRLATSEKWRDKQTGEDRERTEWHSVVLLSEGLAKLAEQYLRKGARVFIEGQLQTRKWQDQEGKDRYSTEVVLKAYAGKMIMLGAPNGNSRREAGDDYPDDYNQDPDPPRNGSGAKKGAGPSDDIPF